MITAKEANEIVNSVEEEKLNSYEVKSTLAYFEKIIRWAAGRGEKVVHCMEDDIVDENNKRVYIGPFYSGNTLIRNYMFKLGFSMSCSDHGHIEITW